ncbi:MAG TPA: DUF4388 domain-containing protein [Candidatus Dormibacteraeota bacterium]|jgi:hypothetical protein
MLDPLVNASIPILAAIVGLGLALLVARRAGRRRRLARLARLQEESRINVSRGSLALTSLPDLMRTLAEYRASGMLELVAHGERFSLYFLFGRIFHAVGPGIEGESALGRALRLPDATYTFKTKTRLPRETTIMATATEAIVPEAVRSR